MESKDKETPAVDGEFKARRRLLKASAAAPLIATLTPNAAAALGSVGTCALRGMDDKSFQDVDKIIEVEGGDSAVRIEGFMYIHNNGTKSPVYRIPEIGVDGSDKYFDSATDKVMDNPPQNLDTAAWTKNKCYFLMHFNIAEDGSFTPIQGKVFMEMPDGHAVSGTCWTSIMAAP